jgi:hypothetical protein
MVLHRVPVPILHHHSTSREVGRGFISTAERRDGVVVPVDEQDGEGSSDVGPRPVVPLLRIELPLRTRPDLRPEAVRKRARGGLRLRPGKSVLVGGGAENPITTGDTVEGVGTLAPRLLGRCGVVLGANEGEGGFPVAAEREVDGLAQVGELSGRVGESLDSLLQNGVRRDVAGLIPWGRDEVLREIDGIGEELLDHGGELEVEVFGGGVGAGEVCEWAQSWSRFDALGEVVYHCAFCVAGHGDPLPRMVVVEAYRAVEEDAADAVGEHACEGLAKDGAVGDAPVLELVLAEGVDNGEHVAGDEGGADVGTDVRHAGGIGTLFGEDATIVPLLAGELSIDIVYGDGMVVFAALCLGICCIGWITMEWDSSSSATTTVSIVEYQDR